MGFSSILDISSFFIGMIINLIFVALMCYYFKRKYDYLYEAQCEQSKIIYQLIHKPPPAPPPSLDFSSDPLLQRSKCSDISSPVQSIHDSDHDQDSESDSEDEMEEYIADSKTVELKIDPNSTQVELKLEKINTLNPVELDPVELDPVDDQVDSTQQLIVEEVHVDDPFEMTIQTELNYNKMSMKQLKDILSSKGIKAKNNIKKDELVELLNKGEISISA